MTMTKLPLALAAVVLTAASAHAQDPVKWTAAPAAKAVTAGGKTTVKLAASIDDGWHIYSVTQGPGGPMPTKVTVPTGQSFALAGAVKGSQPDTKFDENFGIQVETYEGKAEFTVPLTIDKATKSGAQNAQVSVKYQVCNASTCLPPKTEKLTVAMNVKGSGK